MTRSLNPHPYLCSELVSITRHGAPESAVVPGNLEAIGERSAVVLTEVPFKRGTEISITAKSHILRGHVERCLHDGPLGCYIDVQLDSESHWSEQRFRPQHLLDLGTVKQAKCSTKGLTLDDVSVTEKFLRADFLPEREILPGADSTAPEGFYPFYDRMRATLSNPHVNRSRLRRRPLKAAVHDFSPPDSGGDSIGGWEVLLVKSRVRQGRAIPPLRHTVR